MKKLGLIIQILGLPLVLYMLQTQVEILRVWVLIGALILWGCYDTHRDCLLLCKHNRTYLRKGDYKCTIQLK